MVGYFGRKAIDVKDVIAGKDVELSSDERKGADLALLLSGNDARPDSRGDVHQQTIGFSII